MLVLENLNLRHNKLGPKLSLFEYIIKKQKYHVCDLELIMILIWGVPQRGGI